MRFNKINGYGSHASLRNKALTVSQPNRQMLCVETKVHDPTAWDTASATRSPMVKLRVATSASRLAVLCLMHRLNRRQRQQCRHQFAKPPSFIISLSVCSFAASSSSASSYHSILFPLPVAISSKLGPAVMCSCDIFGKLILIS